MRKEKSLARMLFTDVVLFLLLFGAVKVFTDLRTNPSACSPTDQSTTDLSNLALLSSSIDTSSEPAQDLLNSTDWNEVGASYEQTLLGLANQTLVGYEQNSASWKNWTEQNMLVPPSWIDEGPIPYLNTDLETLRSEALNSSSTKQAAGYVLGFASTVAGYDMGALDFVSWNGLTALKTLIDTRNPELALCASFPGQIGQLYSMAFDPNVSSQDRGHYLGEALAITSVMALLGGLGGFTEKFQGALGVEGLDGVWDTIKPSIARLGAISPDLANGALVVLQALAQRFPGIGASEAGLVVFRISGMADVLHESGDSTTDIEAQINNLAQAVPGASSPDDIPDQADDISYQEGHGEDVIVADSQHIYRYSCEYQTIPRPQMASGECSGVRAGPGSILPRILLPGSGVYLQLLRRWEDMDCHCPTRPRTAWEHPDHFGRTSDRVRIHRLDSKNRVFE